MAFPLKNLFGKKEEGEAPGVGQLVAEPGTAFTEAEATSSGAFPPGQSPFQQAPPTAAQAQAPSSPAAKPPAFPDSGSVPLHASAKVAPAAATESPFISQPAAPASEVATEESPFSAAPVSPQVAPAIDDESPFGAPAAAEVVSSPFATVEASPFAGGSETAAEAVAPEPFAAVEALPVSQQAAPDASSSSIESPFGAQDSSFSPAAPTAAGEISSPFAAESPFASMPSASGNADSASTEAFSSFESAEGKVAPAETAIATESPFALAGGESEPPLEAVEPTPVMAPPENVESAAQQTPPEESDAVSPFAAIPASADASPVDVELPLQLLIKPLGEQVLGFAPEKVPASVMTKIPLELIKGQLSSGRVALPLGTVIAGCAERFHKAFVRADRDAQVSVPIPDLYHHLPEGALAPVAPEPVVEPEPEPEEDLAAIFADEPEPEASLPEPSPEIEATPEPAAVVIEPAITEDFASPFPPVSATSEETFPEVEPAAPEMPSLEETSPAEASDTSPFATPFTEAAASEEVPPQEEPEPVTEESVEASPEPIAHVESEAHVPEEEASSALPPFSPFSEEPLTSDDTSSGALSLPSFFDIATPDDEVTETAKAAEEQALEPFPEPTAFFEEEESPQPDIESEVKPEVKAPSALPPLGSMVPSPVEKEEPEEIFSDVAPEEEAPKKLAASPMDAFAEDTTLSDIDSMDELPELGDLDDLFPAEDPTGVFVEETTTAELPVEASPLGSVDPFTDFDAASPDTTTEEEHSAENVFSEAVESKLPDLAPIAVVDPSNVFDSVTEEPAEEAPAIEEPEPLPPVVVSDIDLTADESESEDLSFGIHESDDAHQTALRALFGVEGNVGAERAVDLAAALPGIAACIFTGENSDAIGAGNLDSFATSGPAVFENVRGLVTAMGIDDAACFTIRTSGGTMSFFSEGETCLGVLHKEPRFEPGVREKLTIVARELDAATPSLA